MGIGDSTTLVPVIWNPLNERNHKFNTKTISDVKYITLVMNELHIRRNAKIQRMRSEGKDEKTISRTPINIRPIIDEMEISLKQKNELENLMTDRYKILKYIENIAIGRTGDIYLGNLFEYYYQECTWLLPEIHYFLNNLNYKINNRTRLQLISNASGLYDRNHNKINKKKLFKVNNNYLQQIINSHGRERHKIICSHMRNDGKSASGEGSSIEATRKITNLLNLIIKNQKVGILIDLACGDLTWMKHVVSKNPNLLYIGNDIAREVIDIHKREHLKNKQMIFFNGAMGDSKHMTTLRNAWNAKNIRKNTIILCREVFQHMHHDEVKNTINNIKQFSDSKNQKIIFLATNYIYQLELYNTIPIISGGTNNRNLFVKPWNLPATCTFDDNYDKLLYTTRAQKSISAWYIKNNNIVPCSMGSLHATGRRLNARRRLEKQLHAKGKREYFQKKKQMKPIEKLLTKA